MCLSALQLVLPQCNIIQITGAWRFSTMTIIFNKCDIAHLLVRIQEKQTLQTISVSFRIFNSLLFPSITEKFTELRRDSLDYLTLDVYLFKEVTTFPLN